MSYEYYLKKVVNGSFLAIIHMRGRKPRHISSEIEKFWAVTLGNGCKNVKIISLCIDTNSWNMVK